MLNVTENNDDAQDEIDYHTKKFLGGLANIAKSLANLSDLIDKDQRDPTKSRIYKMPDLTGCKIEDTKDNTTFFKFNFTKYDKLSFDAILPLFYDLQAKILQMDTIDYYNPNEINDPFYNLSTAQSNFDIAYHPLSKFIVGMVSAANLITMIASGAVVKFIPNIMLNISLPIRMLGLALPVAYCIPLVSAYFLNRFYRDKIKDLFEDVGKDIKQKNFVNSRFKLGSLSLPFNIMLNRNFPGNRDLLRQFYYLKSQLCSETSADRFRYASYSLARCDNEHDKLLPLICIINQRGISLKNIIGDMKNSYYGEELKQRIQQITAYSLKDQAVYLSQVPTDAPLYILLGNEFRAELRHCISALKENNFDEAVKNFKKIEFNDYKRYAYPDAAIQYYMIEPIISILSVKKLPYGYNLSDIQYDVCLERAMKNVEIAQDILNKHFPEKSEEYRCMMKCFDEARYKILHSKNTQLSIYEIEESPSNFTPMKNSIPITQEFVDDFIEVHSSVYDADELPSVFTPLKNCTPKSQEFGEDFIEVDSSNNNDKQTSFNSKLKRRHSSI